MTHILKNKNLEIYVDLPLDNYNFSRFDWTGKIRAVKFKNICMSGSEKLIDKNDLTYGNGFYNEFGIDIPVGFDDIKEGDWFHKIGVGILKKKGENYDFMRNYEMKPAKFNVTVESNKIIIDCISHIINGYSYILKKEIELFESSFVIKYNLHNTGQKDISTSEYNHNFLAINKELMGSQYILKFPFKMKPECFGETVNSEEKVQIDQHKITFKNTPEEQFFFSNLSGNENVEASWELVNTKIKIGIREIASFKTKKVNLWGWKHVISPELFFDINLKPGQIIKWSRTYNLFELN